MSDPQRRNKQLVQKCPVLIFFCSECVDHQRLPSPEQHFKGESGLWKQGLYFKRSPWTIVSLDQCLPGQKSCWPNVL